MGTRLHCSCNIFKVICMGHTIDYKLNARCVRQSPPASYVHVVSYLVPWFFSLFWAQCTHTQLNPFYHPFYPDVTHVRKDTRPSPTSLYWKCWKAGWGLEARLLQCIDNNTVSQWYYMIPNKFEISCSFCYIPCSSVG